MKHILLASALLALAGPANAVIWYMLDGSDQQCKVATQTPYALEQGLRAGGYFAHGMRTAEMEQMRRLVRELRAGAKRLVELV